MRRVSKLLVVAVLTIAAAWWTRPATAAVVFDVEGTCDSLCDNVGLSVGDPVSGWISFADAAIVGGASLTKADVLDFALDFGDVEITFASQLGLRIVGTLNAAADGFSAFELFTAEALAPDLGDLIVFEAGGSDGAGYATAFGRCADSSCGGLASVGTAPIFSLGPLALRETNDIPEPGTLALIGAGLAGLALARRRKRT